MKVAAGQLGFLRIDQQSVGRLIVCLADRDVEWQIGVDGPAVDVQVRLEAGLERGARMRAGSQSKRRSNPENGQGKRRADVKSARCR